jgi:hypothetical protein
MSEMSPEMMMLFQALVGRDQKGGMEQELAAYDAMGPEGFKAHSNMGTLDERGALAAQESRAQQEMVQQQLAEMAKFGEAQNKNYGSVAGNVLGGAGDIIRQLTGGIRSGQLRGQQADLAKQGMAAQTGILDQKDAGRMAAGNAQMEALRKVLMGRVQPGPQMSDAGLLEPLIPNFGG